METSIENAVVEAAAALGIEAGSVHDPALAESIGQRLAEGLRAVGAAVVVSWDDLDDAVLGHIVARELGATLSYAYAEEGILGLVPVPASATTVVLVGYEWSRYPGLLPLLSMLRSRGIDVAAVGSVLPLDETPEGIDLRLLA